MMAETRIGVAGPIHLEADRLRQFGSGSLQLDMRHGTFLIPVDKLPHGKASTFPPLRHVSE